MVDPARPFLHLGLDRSLSAQSARFGQTIGLRPDSDA
jgi:hypothetical protein